MTFANFLSTKHIALSFCFTAVSVFFSNNVSETPFLASVSHLFLTIPLSPRKFQDTIAEVCSSFLLLA